MIETLKIAGPIAAAVATVAYVKYRANDNERRISKMETKLESLTTVEPTLCAHYRDRCQAEIYKKLDRLEACIVNESRERIEILKTISTFMSQVKEYMESHR